MITLYCKEDNCTGCKACMDVCPYSAIEFGLNDIGETVPSVDFDKCIECGKCVKTCPQINNIFLSETSNCYAAKRKDLNRMQLSASGGIGATLIESFIEDGGFVFSSSVVDGKAQHICINNKDDIDKVLNSRYVQSDIGNVFKKIKQVIASGCKALFIGTPCQVAAVKQVIGPSSLLFTVDLVCHGVPPQIFFDNHIKAVLDAGFVPSNYTFRNGKSGYELWIYVDNDRVVYKSDRFHDAYYCAYLRGLNHRTSCYACKYAGRNRIGDLTIGDFWGLGRDCSINKTKGKISLIIVNSTEGKRLMDVIDNKIIKEIRSISEAVNGNGSLRKPMKPLLDRERFLAHIRNTGDSEEAMEVVGIRKAEKLYMLKNTFLARAVKKMLRKA